MPYRIHLEKDFCAAFGCCVTAAPEVFALDENRIVIVREDQPAEIEDAKLMKAAQACPVAAIHLFDEAGEQVFPYYL